MISPKFGHWILDAHRRAVPTDLMTWAQWFENVDNRRVADDYVTLSNGKVCQISTVFLGLDHSFGRGPPLLFETMVFGGPLDGDQLRCTTWEQAEAMHAKMLALVTEAVERTSVHE